MADGCTLVEDDDAGLLQELDDGARGVAGRLDDLDALGDADLGVGGVVRGHEGREEGDVDAKGELCHAAAAGNLCAQGLGGRLGEGGQEAEAAGVGDGRGHLCGADVLHAALDDGDADPQLAGELRVERHRGGGCLVEVVEEWDALGGSKVVVASREKEGE